MGRERCLICGAFILAGDDVTHPAGLGVPVHRHCYVKDAGLEPIDERAPEPPDDETAA